MRYVYQSCPLFEFRSLCSNPEFSESDVGIAYGKLANKPITEMTGEDREFVRRVFQHSFSCEYHTREWFLKYIRYLRDSSDDQLTEDDSMRLAYNVWGAVKEYLLN